MILTNIPYFVIIGITKDGRAAWKEEGGRQKIFQYCTHSSGAILYLRALQSHSGCNLIDPEVAQYMHKA